MKRRNQVTIGPVALAGSLLIGASAAAAMPPLVLTGRVQEVDLKNDTIVVLNHVVRSKATPSVAVGQLVNVYGIASRTGSIDGALVETVPTFRGGSNPIFAIGEITAIDPTANGVIVGGTQLRLDELVARAGAEAVTIGNVIQFTGEAGESGAVSLHTAIMGGTGERGAIMGGTGERGAIMGGTGERGAIMGGTGEHGAIMGGTGERGAIMGGTGERGTIMGGTGERGAIMGGTGERGAIMGGTGERGAIMGGTGDSAE